MPLQADFQFSQQSLQDYTDCMRRFYLRYLLRLRYPAPISEPVLEHEKKMARGEQFHRLVHQYFLGIPPDLLSRQINDPTLQGWWENFLMYQPTEDLPRPCLPEHTLWKRYLGYQIVAKYDLLAIGKGQAVILDWKTSEKRVSRAALARRLQTLVYPYLLVEAGSYLNHAKPIEPSRVKMIYWFPAVPQLPEIFQYSSDQYQTDKDRIESLIQEIVAKEKEEEFPQTLDSRNCKFCNYRSYCDRGQKAGDMGELEDDMIIEEELDINLDTTEEIEY